MEGFKKILKRILFLPSFAIVLISVPAFAAVIDVLVKNMNGSLAYISYLAPAYALVILSLGFSGIVRSVHRWVESHPLMKRLLGAPLGRRYVKDVKFRAEVSLGIGFITNLLYITMKMASGIYYRSLWFVSLAIYYALAGSYAFSTALPQEIAGGQSSSGIGSAPLSAVWMCAADDEPRPRRHCDFYGEA
ncbi:MAG: hypothetical protein HFE94_03400 [Acutalibacter sp.]|nr:hypothetical protein [Acutalibacter sp.]